MKNVKNPHALFLAVCLFAINQTIIAQYNNHHKYYIDLGYVGGSQLPHSGTVGVFGGLGFNFNLFNKPATIDIRAKELYVFKPTDQSATILTLTYHAYLIKGFYIGIGGAHGHQIMSSHFMDDPTSAIAGSNEHIMHASGFNTAIGYSFGSFIKNKGIGIYPHVSVTYTQLNAHHQTFKHLALNVGFKIAFKKLN